MVRKILFTISICILVIAGTISLLRYLNKREIADRKKQAGFMIGKIEEYKKKYHKLPQYESDMHLNLPDDYPIYYNLTKDSSVYVVGFQIEAFESASYYSDTKKWDR